MMSTSSVNFARRLWYHWKSLSLPWRRQRLCGYDLTGTTFWEFRDALNSNRFRRIAKPPRRMAYSEIALSPAWIQWLRHTREGAPSLQEQQFEVQRQVQMKELAAQADERWNSQERFADKPKMRTLGEGTGAETVPRDKGGYQRTVGEDGAEGVVSPVRSATEEEGQTADADPARRPTKTQKDIKESPWDKHKRQNPSDGWQPEAWMPPPRGR